MSNHLRAEIAPVGQDGGFLRVPPMEIEAAHRAAVPHRGAWLHVLSSDGRILVVRRSLRMKTCAGLLSIIGEHHSGQEADDHCAARAVREELPGLGTLDGVQMSMLRARPRWFLFDYPADDAGVRRYDRCLITEYVVRLPLNSSQALVALHRGREQEPEHEASQMLFEPLDSFARMLRRRPESICAPELLPRALLDTVFDLCAVPHGGTEVGGSGPPREWPRALQEWCFGFRNRSRRDQQAPAMPQSLDLTRVVHAGSAARVQTSRSRRGR